MMQILEYSLMAVGIITVLGSLIMYHSRTQDRLSPVKILKGEIQLNAREFLANRAGLYVLVMGLLVRYINQLA